MLYARVIEKQGAMCMSKRWILKTHNLTKSFRERRVVDGVSMQIEEGQIYGFLGPNGAGKTTTIRLILNLARPDLGTVSIDGWDIALNYRQAISRVGAVVENPSLYPYLSGYDNLRLGASLATGVGEGHIREILTLVGLGERARDKVGTYSLGMRQRLGIAQALIHRPKLVILDEPTNGLDPKGIKEVQELIRNLARTEKVAFLISSHLLHEVEHLCDTVGILCHGKLIAQGSVGDLLNQDRESFRIGTEQLDEANQLLRRAPFVRKINHTGKELTVTVNKGCGAHVNRLLVTNNIDVRWLIPIGHSLESFFFELTTGGDQQ